MQEGKRPQGERQATKGTRHEASCRSQEAIRNRQRRRTWQEEGGNRKEARALARHKWHEAIAKRREAIIKQQDARDVGHEEKNKRKTNEEEKKE